MSQVREMCSYAISVPFSWWCMCIPDWVGCLAVFFASLFHHWFNTERCLCCGLDDCLPFLLRHWLARGQDCVVYGPSKLVGLCRL